MISWVSDAEVGGGLIDALRELDPLFGSTIVVEPFPDANFSDVLTDIHVALGVGSAESREHRVEGRALWPLAESQIGTLIVVGADAVAGDVVPDLAHLRDVDRLDRVVLIGRSDSQAYERFVAGGGQPGSVELVAGVANSYREPAPDVSPLSASYRRVDRALLNQLVFLSRRIEVTIEAFSRTQIRFATLAAALQLLDRPRSTAGFIARLHALDISLHARRYRLQPDSFADAVKQCAARTQLDLWLPDAIEPSLPRDRMAVVDTPLDRPLPANAQTLARWLAEFGDARTREVYARTVEPLLEWRRRERIDPHDHNAADLEDWAFDRLRAGDAPGSAVMHRSSARRYYLYLLTGRHDAEISPNRRAWRQPQSPLSFPDGLEAIIRAAPCRRITSGPRLLSGPHRSPLESPQARKLLGVFGNDLEGAWQRIEALRLSNELWAKIDPLLRCGDGAQSRRTRGYLNAILLVLGAGLAWDAVPPELNYGSGGRSYRQLRAWVKDETWAAVRSELQNVGVYRDVRWERVSRAPPRAS